MGYDLEMDEQDKAIIMEIFNQIEAKKKAKKLKGCEE